MVLLLGALSLPASIRVGLLWKHSIPHSDTPRLERHPIAQAGQMRMLLLPITQTIACAVAYDTTTLAAVSAARCISPHHMRSFQSEGGLVLRNVMMHDIHEPLRRPGNPTATEMPSIAAETKLAAALVSKLLGARALRE